MLGMATGVPKYKVAQKDAMSLHQKRCPNMKEALGKIYGNTLISNRYMAVPDFTPEADRLEGDACLFDDSSDNKDRFGLTIQERLLRFKKEAIPLVTDTCRRAIADAGVSVNDIHKLVVVSSTGFLGPSLDCELINALGLPRSTDRSLIGFMGCAAAINGYRVAMDYVRAHPGKLALMVCVEISSVHSTFKDSMNDAIIHAIFGDGCAACVMTAQPKHLVPRGTLCITEDHGWLMQGTDDGITLAINDDGISCTLSKNLPKYIAQNMGSFVDSLLAKKNLTRADVDFWAIHPGGRRIIEEAQNGLSLTSAQAADSWHVLDNYGNMLSPSVMFVLDRVFQRNKKALAQGEAGLRMGLAFSFSPGVGAEGIMLQQVN
ncbi:type III polyketide synthase [Ochromonadaceae sp. CCMP2298]|nr:type III polyketide synthase [Ochromonadaceae sp. CCMP2298]